MVESTEILFSRTSQLTWLGLQIPLGALVARDESIYVVTALDGLHVNMPSAYQLLLVGGKVSIANFFVVHEVRSRA